MKAIWIILSLVFGVLIFAWGCMGNSIMFQGVGAVIMVPGLIGLLEKVFPEKEVAKND